MTNCLLCGPPREVSFRRSRRLRSDRSGVVNFSHTSMPKTAGSRVLLTLSLVGALAAAVAMAACSDTTSTAPDIATSVGGPRNGGYTVTADFAKPASVLKTALLWNKRLRKPVTQSFTVDSAKGGTMDVPSLGFTLVVPGNGR